MSVEQDDLLANFDYAVENMALFFDKETSFFLGPEPFDSFEVSYPDLATESQTDGTETSPNANALNPETRATPTDPIPQNHINLNRPSMGQLSLNEPTLPRILEPIEPYLGATPDKIEPNSDEPNLTEPSLNNSTLSGPFEVQGTINSINISNLDSTYDFLQLDFLSEFKEFLDECGLDLSLYVDPRTTTQRVGSQGLDITSSINREGEENIQGRNTTLPVEARPQSWNTTSRIQTRALPSDEPPEPTLRSQAQTLLSPKTLNDLEVSVTNLLLGLSRLLNGKPPKELYTPNLRSLLEDPLLINHKIKLKRVISFYARDEAYYTAISRRFHEPSNVQLTVDSHVAEYYSLHLDEFKELISMMVQSDPETPGMSGVVDFWAHKHPDSFAQLVFGEDVNSVLRKYYPLVSSYDGLQDPAEITHQPKLTREELAQALKEFNEERQLPYEGITEEMAVQYRNIVHKGRLLVGVPAPISMMDLYAIWVAMRFMLIASSTFDGPDFWAKTGSGDSLRQRMLRRVSRTQYKKKTAKEKDLFYVYDNWGRYDLALLLGILRTDVVRVETLLENIAECLGININGERTLIEEIKTQMAKGIKLKRNTWNTKPDFVKYRLYSVLKRALWSRFGFPTNVIEIFVKRDANSIAQNLFKRLKGAKKREANNTPLRKRRRQESEMMVNPSFRKNLVSSKLGGGEAGSHEELKATG